MVYFRRRSWRTIIRIDRRIVVSSASFAGPSSLSTSNLL